MFNRQTNPKEEALAKSMTAQETDFVHIAKSSQFVKAEWPVITGDKETQVRHMQVIKE